MTTVKDFAVIRLLGKGSVYKVTRKSDGFEYALKKVNLREFNSKERKEAVNEIRLLASLFHNSIVRYCEAFVDGDFLYIVTEYAKRGDLDRRIRHQKQKNHYFREDTIWCYFLQMLSGLDYLHRQSVLHRDLKPKNIFLTAADQVRIGDLGCSKLMKGRLTRTQVGTPYYMSPEIWRHMSYNAKCDVWSLGCILFEMCALRPPFQARDMRSLQQKVLSQPVPRLPSCFSRGLSVVVDKMLTKDPSRRLTVAQIFALPEVQSRLRLLPEGVAEDGHAVGACDFRLLSTIKLHQNRARRFDAKLPDASYPVRRLSPELSRDRAKSNDQTTEQSSQVAPPQHSPMRARPDRRHLARARSSPAQLKLPGVSCEAPSDKENAHPNYYNRNKPAVRHAMGGALAPSVAPAAPAHHRRSNQVGSHHHPPSHRGRRGYNQHNRGSSYGGWDRNPTRPW